MCACICFDDRSIHAVDDDASGTAKGKRDNASEKRERVYLRLCTHSVYTLGAAVLCVCNVSSPVLWFDILFSL